MSKIKLIKHKSGLKIFYKKLSINNGVFVKFSFNAGSYNNKNKPGLAHLLEHCFSFGNDKYSREEFRNFRFSLTNSNFYTSRKDMVFWGYFYKHEIDKFFDIYMSVIGNLKLKNEYFLNEKKVVKQEITYNNNALIRRLTLAMESELIEDKLVKRGIADGGLGNVEDINRLVLKDLKEFYKKYFKLSNMNLVCVGNISKHKLLKLVKKYVVKNISNEKMNVKPVINPKLVWDKSNLILMSSDVKDQSRVRLLFKINSLDTSNFMHHKIANLIEEDTQKIAFNIFRTQHGLCYSCDCGIFYYTNQFFFFVDVTCHENQVVEVLNCMPELMDTLRDFNMTEERKKEIIDYFYKIRETSVPHPRNFEEIDVFYDKYGFFITKKMEKTNRKLLLKMPVEEINKILHDILKTQPKLFIISNIDKSKLPNFQDFLQSLYNTDNKTN